MAATCRRGLARRKPDGFWVAGLGVAAAWVVSSDARAQVYFDARNPFTAPVPPLPAEQPTPTTPGDEFQARENLPYRPGAFNPGAYNLKMGPVYASFGAGVGLTYTDNALQTATGDKEANLTVGPSLNGSLRWQATENARLQLGIGVGYYASLLVDNLDQLSINPGTSIDYAFSLGDVVLTFYDRVSSGSSVGLRNDIVGTGNSQGLRFNRLNNAAGLSASWVPLLGTSVNGSYSFSMDKGINDSYGQLDGQSHSLSASVFQRLGVRWTAGLSGGASQNSYQQKFQNSSKSFGVGPLVTWKPTSFLNFSASIRYTLMASENDGQTGDQSDFSGLTGSFSIGHRINRYMSHGVSFGRNANMALGSNFSVSYNAAYNLTWQVTERVPISLGFDYDSFKQSGGLQIFARPPRSIYVPANPATGEPSALYVFDDPLNPLVPTAVFKGVVQTPDGFIGVPTAGQSGNSWGVSLSTGLQLTRKLSSSLGWSYRSRTSDFVYGSFAAHSVTLSFGYQF